MWLSLEQRCEALMDAWLSTLRTVLRCRQAGKFDFSWCNLVLCFVSNQPERQKTLQHFHGAGELYSSLTPAH